MTIRNAWQIGNLFEKFLGVDFTLDHQVGWKNYLRIRVLQGIQRPLVAGFSMDQPKGTWKWIPNIYKRLEIIIVDVGVYLTMFLIVHSCLKKWSHCLLLKNIPCIDYGYEWRKGKNLLRFSQLH